MIKIIILINGFICDIQLVKDILNIYVGLQKKKKLKFFNLIGSVRNWKQFLIFQQTKRNSLLITKQRYPNH